MTKEFKTSKVCQTLDINRSSLYYRKKNVNYYTKEEAKAVKEIFKKTLGAFGRRTIRQYLIKGYYKSKEILLSERKITRIMKDNNLKSKHGRKKIGRSMHNFEKRYISNNLILKKKIEDIKEKVYASDITEIKCKDGRLYGSGVMHLNCRTVDCTIYKAIPKAKDLHKDFDRCIRKYGVPDIFHTDRGAQYMSRELKVFFEQKNIKQSMSLPYSPNNNQYIESFWKTMKTEIGPTEYFTMEEAKMVIEYYIMFYNTKRLHSSLNYMTPMDAMKESKKFTVGHALQ